MDTEFWLSRNEFDQENLNANKEFKIHKYLTV